MKSASKLLLLMCVTLTASWATADLPRKSVYLGAYGGAHIPEAWQMGNIEGTGVVLQDSATWGLRVGTNFSPYGGIEANVAFIPTKTTTDEQVQTLDFGVSLFGQAALGKMAFFGLAGGGLYASTDSVLDTDVNWQAHVGLGIKAQLFEHGAIRLQARYLFTEGPDEENETSENLELTIGMDFFVWRTADDRDEDGIPDDVDACPDVKGVPSAKGCPDKDGDGFPDSKDACPEIPGVASADGCPDADGDGITDKNDRCPKVAGPSEHKGCPDKDGDKIVDIDDECPDVPGIAALNGCPDKDGDGITDAKDACPDEAGPKSTNGCPDTDKDGIADKDDKCPKIPGIKSEQGCLPKAVAEKFSGALKGIYFKTGSAKIKPKSFTVLDEAVSILKEYPTVNVRIEGHTDDRGKDDLNLTLSQARADSVKAYLVEKGVAGDRMKAVGLGETKPIADNKKGKGRAENRRIEFRVIVR